MSSGLAFVDAFYVLAVIGSALLAIRKRGLDITSDADDEEAARTPAVIRVRVSPSSLVSASRSLLGRAAFCGNFMPMHNSSA